MNSHLVDKVKVVIQKEVNKLYIQYMLNIPPIQYLKWAMKDIIIQSMNIGCIQFSFM